MDLTVVIINFNSGDQLARALGTLTGLPAGTEVIVVDNASDDGSADLDGRAPRPAPGTSIRWVSMRENAGFARAANAGIRESRGDLILLLNPDMIVEPGAIGRLVRRMRADPAIGAVGPRIRDRAAAGQRFLRPFPTNGSLLREALFLDRLIPERGDGAGWLQGCCLLLRKEAIREVGPFDPGYFLYYEDVDLLWRMRHSRWRAEIDPGCEVTHDGGGRAGRYCAEKIRRYHDGLLTFYRKHYGEASLRPLRRILILRSVIRLGGWAVLYALAPRNRAARAERMRGYASVLGALWRHEGVSADNGRPRD